MALYNRAMMFLYYLLLSISVISGWPSQLISQGLVKHLAHSNSAVKGLMKQLFTKMWAGLKGTNKSGEAMVLIWGLKKQVEGVITRTLSQGGS